MISEVRTARQHNSCHPRITTHTYGTGETTVSHSAHRLNDSQHMSLSIHRDQTSTFLSGVGRQPLRERHVCPNVNDDIPQQRCKEEGRRRPQHPHARTLYRSKAHSARCVARPAGQDPADEHRPAVKEGHDQSKVLRMHRKVNVESFSSIRPTSTRTVTSTAVSRATLEDTIGASKVLGDVRRRTNAGTMHSVVSGDVRDNLERWRNHYSKSTISSLSYVRSPLDAVTATDPTYASFASNADPGRRKPSTFLVANGPGLSSQHGPRRRCCICESELSHSSQEGAARAGEDGILGIKKQPVRVRPTARTGLSLRPAAAVAEGCWFCHGLEAVDEKPAGLGADCRGVIAAPIATVGGHVRSSGGWARFDGRADEPEVGDGHNGSAEHRLEVDVGMHAESSVAERVEVHVGMQARSGVENVGQERAMREAYATIYAAEGLNCGSTKGRDPGAGEQRRSAEQCRANRWGLVGRGLSECLVDDGLTTLRSATHRQCQGWGRDRQHGNFIRVATLAKDGFLEGTSSGDGANLGGRKGGGGCDGEMRNSAKADGEMGNKSLPQRGPRGKSTPIREAACCRDEGDEGRSPGGAFGDPLCWEEEGVWWFRPRVNDATHGSHTDAVVVSPEYRSEREAKQTN